MCYATPKIYIDTVMFHFLQHVHVLNEGVVGAFIMSSFVAYHELSKTLIMFLFTRKISPVARYPSNHICYSSIPQVVELVPCSPGIPLTWVQSQVGGIHSDLDDHYNGGPVSLDPQWHAKEP